MSQNDTDNITFTSGQLAWLEGIFPQVAHGPLVTEPQLRHYHGQQSVVLKVRERTRGVNPKLTTNPRDIPRPRGSSSES